MVNFTDVKIKYQTSMDLLIANAGKPVRIFFKTTNSGVTQTQQDSIRPNQLKDAAWKNPASLTVVQNTKDIIALIKHSPKEFKRFNINIDYPNEIIRLKTDMSYTNDFSRADYIIPNFNNTNIVYSRYKLIRDPRLFGLIEDKYIKTYWERI